MFKLMGKEINAILGAKTILIWTCDMSLKLQNKRSLYKIIRLLHYHFLQHFYYRPNANKRVISKDNVTVLKARGKRTLGAVSCYCKVTSVVV